MNHSDIRAGLQCIDHAERIAFEWPGDFQYARTDSLQWLSNVSLTASAAMVSAVRHTILAPSEKFLEFMSCGLQPRNGSRFASLGHPSAYVDVVIFDNSRSSAGWICAVRFLIVAGRSALWQVAFLPLSRITRGLPKWPRSAGPASRPPQFTSTFFRPSAFVSTTTVSFPFTVTRCFP